MRKAVFFIVFMLMLILVSSKNANASTSTNSLKVNQLVNSCKGKSETEKISLIIKFCDKNIKLTDCKFKSVKKVIAKRKTNKEGLARTKAYLIKKICKLRVGIRYEPQIQDWIIGYVKDGQTFIITEKKK